MVVDAVSISLNVWDNLGTFEQRLRSFSRLNYQLRNLNNVAKTASTNLVLEVTTVKINYLSTHIRR